MHNFFIIQEYIDRSHSYLQINRDASKMSANEVGVAFIIPEFHVKVE